jgi:hypothetical protein
VTVPASRAISAERAPRAAQAPTPASGSEVVQTIAPVPGPEPLWRLASG